MEKTDWTDPETGRQYKVLKDGTSQIPIGPPEGLVDTLNIPEPFATNLHNALCRRGILSYEDVKTKQNALQGALQEAYTLDAQRLYQAYFEIQKEEVPT